MFKKLCAVLLFAFTVQAAVQAYEVFVSITDTTSLGSGEAFMSELERVRGIDVSDDVFMADFHIAVIIAETGTGIGRGFALAVIITPSFVPTFGINTLHSLVLERDRQTLLRGAADQIALYFSQILPDTVQFIAENYEAITEMRRDSGRDVGFLE